MPPKRDVRPALIIIFFRRRRVLSSVKHEYLSHCGFGGDEVLVLRHVSGSVNFAIMDNTLLDLDSGLRVAVLAYLAPVPVVLFLLLVGNGRASRGSRGCRCFREGD